MCLHVFVLQGIMVLVLYTFLRNPCIQKCFGPQKSNYPLNTGTDGLPLPSHHPNVLDIGTLKESRASVLNEVSSLFRFFIDVFSRFCKIYYLCQQQPRQV